MLADRFPKVSARAALCTALVIGTVLLAGCGGGPYRNPYPTPLDTYVPYDYHTSLWAERDRELAETIERAEAAMEYVPNISPPPRVYDLPPDPFPIEPVIPPTPIPSVPVCPPMPPPIP